MEPEILVYLSIVALHIVAGCVYAGWVWDRDTDPTEWVILCAFAGTIFFILYPMLLVIGTLALIIQSVRFIRRRIFPHV